MGGTAIWRASEMIVAKGRRIAAEVLEAAEADIISPTGLPRRRHQPSVPLLEVAARARAPDTPLDTYHAWTRERMTYPNGAHVAEVEIDRDTGQVSSGAADRGGRLRRAGEPDDRRRPGARRDRPGCRPGAAGARGLRRGNRPADCRIVHGLRHAARR